MKRFKFKLDSILKFRSQMEEQIKREFAFIQGELSNEEEKLLEFEGFLAHEAETMVGKEELSTSEFELFVGYLKGIRARMEDQKKVIEECEGRVESKRAELIEAVKEKKVLEALKDKNLKAYEKTLLKIEERMLDEHNASVYVRESA